jgi:hypothetical protein
LQSDKDYSKRLQAVLSNQMKGVDPESAECCDNRF